MATEIISFSHPNTSQNSKAIRDSNFELLRIVAMFLIIASHWGTEFVGEEYHIKQELFYTNFCDCGQVGVIIFLLISAYFLCTKNFRTLALVKLLIENIFINLLVFIAFVIYNQVCNDENVFIITDLLNCFLIFTKNNWFLQVYYAMFIFAPFLNLVLSRINKKQYLFLIIFLFSIICIFSPNAGLRIRNNDLIYNFMWSILIYCVGAYIRFFPSDFNGKLFPFLGIILLVIVKIFIPQLYHKNRNDLCVFFLSLFCFCLFKNLKMKTNHCINLIASTTLGIYLLHENFFRLIIWRDWLQIPKFLESNWLWLIMITAVIIVFNICALLTLLLRYTFGNPFFKFLDRKMEKLFAKIDNFFPTAEFIDREDVPIKYFYLHVSVVIILYLCTAAENELFALIPNTIFFVLGILCYVLLCFLVRYIIHRVHVNIKE